MTPKTPPGQTRQRIYDFVRQRILEGVPPTVREVQEMFGFKSVRTAKQHLDNLVAEGRLETSMGKARGYRLPSGMGPMATQLVPLVGQVQAGALTTAMEMPEGYMAMPSQHGQTGPTDEQFALRVRGESMRDVGILPDDILIVQRQADAQDGDIVVALVDDEATVKRLRKRKGYIELQPENPSFDSIFIETQEMLQRFVLLGKVREVRRYLTGSPIDVDWVDL